MMKHRLDRFLTLSALAALLAFLAIGLSGCSVPDANATITVDAPSDSSSEWYPVADYLDHRCGALDCHGDRQRNLVLYGCNGLRLDPNDVPGCQTGPNAPNTTDAEYAASYRSLVGLEPAVMTEVVSSGGADPDLLTFVRKARGEEAHKGGMLITPGDVQDQCITTWLAGATNAVACVTALDDFP